MKLQDSLYTVTGSRSTDGGAEYGIRLNPEHFIYAAHFPGEPITPGVCIMQTAVELLSLHLGCGLELKTVKSIKFLKIISPAESVDISCSIGKISCDGDAVKAQFTFFSADDVYARLSLTCVRKK